MTMGSALIIGWFTTRAMAFLIQASFYTLYKISPNLSCSLAQNEPPKVTDY